jgi:rhamnose transport system substrate-binding protein
MREYVKSGASPEFALWNPGDLGYLAVYTIYHMVNGDITGAPGDTFEAGKLGEYTILEDGTILLGAPTVFDADNIDDFDF